MPSFQKPNNYNKGYQKNTSNKEQEKAAPVQKGEDRDLVGFFYKRDTKTGEAFYKAIIDGYEYYINETKKYVDKNGNTTLVLTKAKNPLPPRD